MPRDLPCLYRTLFLIVTATAWPAIAQSPKPVGTGGPANVLVVVNDASSISKSIGEYYVQRRAIPPKNVCHIRTPPDEAISRADYNRSIAVPISGCLKKDQMGEQILYIVTTLGVPLNIPGGDGLNGDMASVDSELTLLYDDMKQPRNHVLNGMLKNPFFSKTAAEFNHSNFPIYLVTRLAAYDLQGVKDMIDRGLSARNRGKFVIDLKSSEYEDGNNWLHAAAALLPADRVILDETDTVLYKQTDVIAYAGWGSNDSNRHERFLGFKWLPGAIATEFVSTNGRTFQRPPNNWNISTWKDRTNWWIGAPQTLSADYILEGASAVTGHVDEPFLMGCPRPEYMLPAYFSGRNLAESSYVAIPFLSWQNIVVGDPLMSLGKP